MLKKITKNTVAAQIINQLIDLVQSGKLKPGDRLPSERDMAKELGVSRPPLRESLRALEYADIIETRYGDGVYVKRTNFPIYNNVYFARLLNQYTLEETIEIRKVVESAAVRFAIERAADEDIDSLADVLAKSWEVIDDVAEFVECDFAFHSGIAELSRNSLLFNTVQNMRKMIDEFNNEFLEDRGHREDVCRSHTAVFRSMQARNADAAVRAMEAHLENVLSVAAKYQPDDEALGFGAAKAAGNEAAPKKKRIF